MSVYIKGMEMPKYGCDHCFLRTGNYCGRIEKDESVVEYARKNERHPDCPLVPVPPHGDLIDKDATMNAILEERGEDTACWFAGIVNDMPAVIPSDKTEEGE